ncbi:MAG: PD40 domain-containing protein, partial [Planctomycetes bacterium]|nr:PD40 domain-containing protein [Planctomycetota bacterium]
MFWEHVPASIVGLSTDAVQFAGGLLLQSTLLIGLGLLVARSVRAKGAALESAVYRTTLVAVVLCPAVSLLLAAAGVEGLALTLPQVAWRTDDAAPPPSETQDPVDTADPASLAQGHAGFPSGGATARDSVVNDSTAAPVSIVDGSPAGPAAAPIAQASATSSWSLAARTVCLLTAAWLAGSCFLLTRLVAAYLGVVRLSRTACQVESATVAECRAVARRMGVRPPLVRRSPFVASPCLVGLCRPMILLPEGDPACRESESDVLVHEAAHLARRDHLWSFVGRLSAAVLFYQPLVWLLARRTVCAAEEVCDDQVVDFGSDRRDYARRLTDVAARLQPRLAVAGVGMVPRKSLLRRRIVRILDSSRTLSVRTGLGAASATVLIGGLVTTLVALATIDPHRAEAATDDEQVAPVVERYVPVREEKPIDVAASHDGKTAYLACAGSKRLIVIDLTRRKALTSLAMPAEPTGLVLSPDGAALYVTCAGPEGSVAVVDVKSLSVARLIRVGHGATGPAISPDGKRLYVCNRFDNNVAVVDLATGRIALAPTTREPYAAAVTPDGKSVFVVNQLPAGRGDEFDVASVVTVIDTATKKTETIRMLNGSTCMRGICVSPDGRHVYATHLLSRYQMPTTQVQRGWMNTNALTIIDARQKKRINTVLLDEVDLGAANPWGVALTADGKTICVTLAGTHEMSVIDAEALLDKLLALPEKRDPDSRDPTTIADVPNDLSFLDGLRRRVLLTTGKAHQKPTVNGPRGLAVVGSKAYVAGYFSDNLAVVDLEPKPGDPEESDLVSTIALGPAPEISVERRGEMLFNDATLCHQHWQSCDSCHPDARADALNWDLMNDGMGNPKNARSMVLAHKTPPSMSAGVLSDAEAAVRSEVTHLLFSVPAEEDAVAIDAYLKSLKPVPSPHLAGGKLSPAAERGKELFFDEKINCAKCHPEPLFTDMQVRDVGSRGQY